MMISARCVKRAEGWSTGGSGSPIAWSRSAVSPGSDLAGLDRRVERAGLPRSRSAKFLCRAEFIAAMPASAITPTTDFSDRGKPVTTVRR